MLFAVIYKWKMWRFQDVCKIPLFILQSHPVCFKYPVYIHGQIALKEPCIVSLICIFLFLGSDSESQVTDLDFRGLIFVLSHTSLWLQ